MMYYKTFIEAMAFANKAMEWEYPVITYVVVELEANNLWTVWLG